MVLKRIPFACRLAVVYSVAFACGAAAACDLPPLSSEDLYLSDAAALTAAPDGGVVDGRLPDERMGPDAYLSPVGRADAQEPLDTAELACAAESGPGVLSGVVVDACTGVQLEAHVGIAGVHVCSFAAKGSFFIRGLPTGCRYLLTSGREGYEQYDERISIAAGGTDVRIVLKRKGGCMAPAPAAETGCRCDASPCGG